MKTNTILIFVLTLFLCKAALSEIIVIRAHDDVSLITRTYANNNLINNKPGIVSHTFDSLWVASFMC